MDADQRVRGRRRIGPRRPRWLMSASGSEIYVWRVRLRVNAPTKNYASKKPRRASVWPRLRTSFHSTDPLNLCGELERAELRWSRHEVAVIHRHHLFDGTWTFPLTENPMGYF